MLLNFNELVTSSHHCCFSAYKYRYRSTDLCVVYEYVVGCRERERVCRASWYLYDAKVHIHENFSTAQFDHAVSVSWIIYCRWQWIFSANPIVPLYSVVLKTISWNFCTPSLLSAYVSVTVSVWLVCLCVYMFFCSTAHTVPPWKILFVGH